MKQPTTLLVRIYDAIGNLSDRTIHGRTTMKDLFVSDEVARALEQGIERGRRIERHAHQCSTAETRPYPTSIVSRLDDVADAAYLVKGRDVYEAVDALDEWLRGPYADPANGERAEPDWEAAARVLADNDGIEIIEWHEDLSRRVVKAAIGDRLLIDPPKEEE